MQGSSNIKSNMFPDGKGQMDNRGSCGFVDVDVGPSNKRIQEQQSKTSIIIGSTATMAPRRSVFEVSETRLFVPMTQKPARLERQCIRQNAYTFTIMPSKKDVGMQTVPLPSSQKQPAEMCSTDGETKDKDATYKDIVKKFFLRRNMKTTILFKKYMENLSARRIVAAAFNRNNRKYLSYFSLFSIGVIAGYMICTIYNS